MKKFFSVVSIVLLSVSLWAQAPQSFSYQAVIRGINNVLVANKPVGMKISLLQGSEIGTAVYVETHKPTSNANGLVSISIGGGSVVMGSFVHIDWSKGPYFVKTETDVTGGTNYSLTSVSQLLSVPYALTSSNGISRVSVTGDSLILANGTSIIITGISNETNNKPTYGPNITDVEGNSYKTVTIGTQTWMAENLKVSKYNDGTLIPNVKDNTEWLNLMTGAWSNYDNSDSLGAKYGKLYNWYAVSPTTNGNKNVCPTGWHAPSDAEWTVLTDYLGGVDKAGEKMRTTELNAWDYPYEISTNSSMYFGIGGGIRNNAGGYSDLRKLAAWWSTNIYDSISVTFRYLLPGKYGPNSCSTCTYNTPKQSGLSVRCLKD